MIRPYQDSDLPRLSVLFDLYRQFYLQPSNREAGQAFLQERQSLGESVILVADFNGEAHGFVQLYPSFSSVGLQRTWILNDLFVTAEARGEGLGEALVKASMDFVLSQGASRLSLMTAVTNTAAQKLYEKLGWMKNKDYFTYNWRSA